MTIVTDSAPAAPAPVLFPLQTFLKLYSLSKSEFYRMCSRGEAPDLVKLGRRTLIPAASAAAWLAARVRPAIEISRARGAAG
jgi:predicted DNA-binding transcriptional regulator AlpA